jgi:hypothetical protein
VKLKMKCKVKASVKQLRHLVHEEASTAKVYRHHGWRSQARDEARHSKFFKKQLKKKLKCG